MVECQGNQRQARRAERHEGCEMMAGYEAISYRLHRWTTKRSSLRQPAVPPGINFDAYILSISVYRFSPCNCARTEEPPIRACSLLSAGKTFAAGAIL